MLLGTCLQSSLGKDNQQVSYTDGSVIRGLVQDAKIKLILKQAYTSIDIGFSDSSFAATERAICFLSSLYSVILKKRPESESIVIVGRKIFGREFTLQSCISSILQPSVI